MKWKIFDAHCDTIYRCVEDETAHLTGKTGQWDLDRLNVYDGAAQFFAFFWDSAKTKLTPEENLERYYSAFRREMDNHSDRITQCRTGEEAEQAIAKGKCAAFLSVEGGELLGCDLKLLRRAYEMGVRAVNLTWNHANALSGSHKEEPHRGLSERGIGFLREMEKLGMLPDVSHLSEKGFWDVMKYAEKPILASHSNSQNTYFHSRNLTDEQFTAIIKNHGIVGLNGYGAFIGDHPAAAEDLLRHLEHFLALGGEKNVALGGDWDGCDLLPQGWTGVWNWADFAELLLTRNYSESLVHDLFFNNLMRTVKRVCIM